MKTGVSRTVSAAAETTTSSAVNATQMPRRTHSVQERHGQTVYLQSADPVSADISLSSATVTPGAITTGPPPSTAVAGGPSGWLEDGVTSTRSMTVSAPAGVDVRHDADSRTFTLTFGVDDVGVPDTTVTKISTAQLIWQPPTTTTTTQRQAPADDVSDAGTQETDTAKHPLSRLLSESTEEPPDTPTSPDGRKSQYLIMIATASFLSSAEYVTLILPYLCSVSILRMC